MPTGGGSAAMSTTYTSQEPGPDGPAHADAGQIRPGDVAGEAHGPDDHGETHGHDDHAHPAEALGPVDVMAWGALLLGLAAGLLVVACLVITTSLAASPTL
jgi:hypothetical protein